MRLKTNVYRRAVAHISKRTYHDESFGFRKPREFTLPDCEPRTSEAALRRLSTRPWLMRAPADTPAQLANRVANAPLLRYIDSVRTHGHRAARVDPLDLLQREEVPALDPARYGLADPAQTYDVNGILWTRDADTDAPELWTLADISTHLRSVYVGRIAYEYMHSHSKTERMWFAHMLEGPREHARRGGSGSGSSAWRARLHALLVQSETFDQFLQAKFPNLKRYGLEGGESMIPALDTLFHVAARGAFFPTHSPHAC
jgi:probable 2-oxoglutarate dehydrogenase E1 component DHKTD1